MRTTWYTTCLWARGVILPKEELEGGGGSGRGSGRWGGGGGFGSGVGGEFKRRTDNRGGKRGWLLELGLSGFGWASGSGGGFAGFLAELLEFG